jgi:2-oxoisovalerate/pyruvate ferredoxin oxidoreductase gamma subunit
MPSGGRWMIEIVFYGRGGQGAVTAAQVLATAAFREGKFAQAFPSFGPERRGAPVTAYARIDQNRIADRSQISKADYVIVLDPNVIKTANPLNSVKAGGAAILNVDRTAEDIIGELAINDFRLFCVNATTISEEVYGRKSIPITNIAMLGAFSYVSQAVQMKNVLLAVDNFFSGDRAVEAKKTAQMAYERMAGA